MRRPSAIATRNTTRCVVRRVATAGGVRAEGVIDTAPWETITLPAFVFDRETMTIAAANQAAAQFFGCEVESLVGTPVVTGASDPRTVRVLGYPTDPAQESRDPAWWRSRRRDEFTSLIDSYVWNGRSSGLAVWYDVEEGDAAAHGPRSRACRTATAVFEGALEGIIVIDQQGIIDFVNPAAELMFGYSNGGMVGRKVEALMPRSIGQRHADFVRHAIESGISNPGRPRLFRSVRADGSEFDSAVSLTSLHAEEPLFCAVFRDVTGDLLEQQHLERIARTDQVTGLANRRTFDDWWSALRGTTNPLAVLGIEICRFSTLTEGFGQRVADEILGAVGGRLAVVAESRGARIARKAEGRFLVLALNCEPESAAELTEALHAALRDEIDASGVLFQPVANIGVALRAVADDPVDSIVAEVSAALTSLGRLGVGQTAISVPGAQRVAAQEISLEAELRRAIAEGDILMALQPVYRISDGRIIGAEALARWTLAGQPVPPDKFVTLAERTGLIIELSAMLRRQVFAQVPRFVAIADGNPWRVWINVSPRELIDVDFASRLLADVERADVDPRRIGIEVTETAVLTSPETVQAAVRELRRAGVVVALDDFGTGHSSATTLLHFEVDVVKIDRSFTANLPADARSAAIVRGLTTAVHMMGCEVTFEGIETVEQLAWVAANGGQSGQGYLFSAAVSPDELASLMREGPFQLRH